MPRRNDARARRAGSRTGRKVVEHGEDRRCSRRPRSKDLDTRLERLHEIADRIYDRWTENLSRGKQGDYPRFNPGS